MCGDETVEAEVEERTSGYGAENLLYERSLSALVRLKLYHHIYLQIII